MFKTINEGLEVFKSEVGNYFYNSIVLKSENNDFQLNMLEGMKKALGLTQDEVSKIWKEAENKVWEEREKNELKKSKKDN
jgi:hypothetical protein